jgi:formate dehydrogenase subunit gamma
VTAKTEHKDELLRYRIGQRVVHALLATSFLTLLVTGMALIVPFMRPLVENGTSRQLHRIAALLFMAVPVVYLIVDWRGAVELVKESFTYDRDDLKWTKYSYRYFFGRAVDMPPQGRLNAGQKVHHAGVIIFSALVVISGLLMWFGKGMLGATGLSLTALLHDTAMFALTILLVGHLYFTYVYQALSSMTTGYVPLEDAEIEHSKWVEEMQGEAST